MTLAGAFAVLTVLTHVAQAFGIPFEWYARVGLVMALCALLVAGVALRRGRRVHQKDPGSICSLVALAACGAVVALIADRPDADDYYYVPNAVYALQHPSQSMGFEVRFIYPGGEPFRAHTWASSLPYEYVQAIAARYLGVEYGTVYYLLFPAVAGALIPLAAFYAVSRFARRTFDACVGAAIISGVLLLLGETHRTFGNFAFVRVFQGKAVCMSVGIPLLTAVTLDFFQQRSWPAWLSVLATATAATGLTGSTLVLFPVLAIVMAIAMILSSKSPRQLLGLVAAYAGAFAYLVATTVAFWMQARGEPATAPDFPDRFADHWAFLVSPSCPVTLIVVLTFAVGSLILSGRWERRFLANWMLVSIALYLNPLCGDWLIRHVAPLRAIYWRLFYTFPFPLVAGITGAALAARARVWPRAAQAMAVGLAALILVGGHFLPGIRPVFRGITVGWPTYKLPPIPLREAREVVKVAPQGSILASREISGIIGILQSGYLPLGNCEDGLRRWLAMRGQSNEAELRIQASDFVAGRSDNFESFAEIVKRIQPKSVVMTKGVFSRTDVVAELQRQRYVRRAATDLHVIVWQE